jgi:hypothetical protein
MKPVSARWPQDTGLSAPLGGVHRIDGVVYHRHPNGGGLVAETASVAPTAFVGYDARVGGDARVCGNARVGDGALVGGGDERD